ncbi:MAG: hypothetical protein Kow0067_14870 [Coriobacteriia bacterium]
MALADIIGRIESDAGHEARAVSEAAAARAAEIISAAEDEAERLRADALERAVREAEAEAATIAANARLTARDRALAAKRELVEAVLARAAEELEALPAEEYARLIAAGVVDAARGDDVVRVAGADRGRLAGLADVVATVASQRGRRLDLTFSDEPAPLEHGVMLESHRVSAEVSVRAMIEARRAELMALAASALFPKEARSR